MPELLGNLNREPSAPSLPIHFEARIGDAWLFLRFDELWRTDGTAEGTHRLCGPDPDVCVLPGLALPSPESYLLLDDREFTSFRIFPDRGILRRTDGTAAGTLPLIDPEKVVLDPTFPARHFAVHEPSQTVLFQAEDLEADTGRELWITDGTVDGTRELVDLAFGSFSSSPEFGAAVGSRVVFAAEDLELGREPWVTDGTAEGTRRLVDVNPGAGSSDPSSFSVLGDRVLFFATGSDRRRGLYRTDGTPSETQRLAELGDVVGFPFTGFLGSEFAGLRLFVDLQDDEIRVWVTDGTADGTRSFLSFEPGAGPLGEAARIGSIMLFVAGESAHELWLTDGTFAGTRRLLSGPSEALPDFFPRIGQPTSLGDRVVFPRPDLTHGEELWITDGTPEGTRLLADLCSGPCSSDPQPILRRDGLLQVWADAGDGRELWSIRLATGEVTRLTDFTGLRPFSGIPAPFDGDVIFAASDLTHGQALWRSDGTVEGISPFFTLAPPGDGSSSPEDFVRFGREVFFTTSSPEAELWATRGTVSGTRLAWRAPDDVFLLSGLTRFGDALLFFALTEGNSVDLYRSDGTSEGTVVIAEDFDGNVFSRIVVAEDKAYLLGLEPGGVWVTDATVEGTEPLGDFGFTALSAAVALGDRVFFTTRSQNVFTLWTSDGTAEGTHPVNPEIQLVARSQLTVAGDVLYFLARGLARSVVWRSDGTPSGTRPLETAEGFVAGSGLFTVGSRLFFFGRGEGTPTGLWVTDPGGVSAQRIATVPGTEGVAVDETLYFLVGVPLADPFMGRIWRSDGTPEGTHPIDVLPPTLAQPIRLENAAGHLLITTVGGSRTRLWLADPDGDSALRLEDLELAEGFTRIGRRVVFAGTTEETGVEPWGIDLPPRPGDPSESPPLAPRKLDR